MQVIDEISPRSRDSIIGFGEKLGCKIITAALRDRVSTIHNLCASIRTHLHYLTTQGIDAEFVSLENVVPPTEDAEGTLGQPFYDAVSAAFAERIQQCGSRVPVVTGSSLIFFSTPLPLPPNTK